MKTKQTKTGEKRITLRLPSDVHQNVCSLALVDDRTLNGQIVAFLRECIKSRLKEQVHAPQN